MFIFISGLTSPGAEMSVDLPVEAVAAIHAQGKTHALAIGLLKLSTVDM